MIETLTNTHTLVLVETRCVRDFVAQLKKSNDRFRTISTYRMHYVRTGGGDNGGGCIYGWVFTTK